MQRCGGRSMAWGFEELCGGQCGWKQQVRREAGRAEAIQALRRQHTKKATGGIYDSEQDQEHWRAQRGNAAVSPAFLTGSLYLESGKDFYRHKSEARRSSGSFHNTSDERWLYGDSRWEASLTKERKKNT